MNEFQNHRKKSFNFGDAIKKMTKLKVNSIYYIVSKYDQSEKYEGVCVRCGIERAEFLIENNNKVFDFRNYKFAEVEE